MKFIFGIVIIIGNKIFGMNYFYIKSFFYVLYILIKGDMEWNIL